MDKKSELSWDLQDFTQRGLEPPERVAANPKLCEGKMMSDQEIEEYVNDGVAALRVLGEKGSDRLEPVKQAFLADMLCLLELGRISADEYNVIIKEDNFSY